MLLSTVRPKSKRLAVGCSGGGTGDGAFGDAGPGWFTVAAVMASANGFENGLLSPPVWESAEVGSENMKW